MTRDDVITRLRAAGCVFAEEEADLLLEAAVDPAELASLVEQRAAGLPLEHLLGWVEFCGRRWAVAPGVFTPRRRTELLVREAVALARPGMVVVDLCCGCGAIGAAVAVAVPGVRLVAADLDVDAVRVARRNVEPLGGQVLAGDLFAALPPELRGRVHVLAVNAPYVPTAAIALMPPEAREYEKTMALDGGPDGLDVHRRVLAGVGEWLAPGGHLLIETSSAQAPVAVAAFGSAGLEAWAVVEKELDATVVVGRWPFDQDKHVVITELKG